MIEMWLLYTAAMERHVCLSVCLSVCHNALIVYHYCKCVNRTANHTMPNGEGNSSDLQVQVAMDSLGYRFQTFVASIWKLEYKLFHREEYFQ